jgi:hypothetical protein
MEKEKSVQEYLVEIVGLAVLVAVLALLTFG